MRPVIKRLICGGKAKGVTLIAVTLLCACLPHEAGKRGDNSNNLNADRSTTSLNAAQLHQISNRIQKYLTDRFNQSQSALSASDATCANPAAATAKAYALLAAGREQDCMTFVRQCESQGVDSLGKGRLLSAGAQCAWKARAYDETYRLYSLAVDPAKYRSDSTYSQRVFDFARFVEIVSYKTPNETSPERTAQKIFALGFNATKREEFTAPYSLLKASVSGSSNVFDKDAAGFDFDTYIAGKISGAADEISDFYTYLLFSVMASSDSRNRDALKLLGDALAQNRLKTLPYHQLHGLFIRSYTSLYKQTSSGLIPNPDPNVQGQLQVNNVGLYEAQRLYFCLLTVFQSQIQPAGIPKLFELRSYSAKTNANKNMLPADQNGRTSLDAVESEFESGAKNIDESIVAAKVLDTDEGLADVRTFIGYMYHLKGDLDQAEEYYYNAHKVCQYYNRAHDGLRAIRFKTANAALPQAGEQKQKFLSTAVAAPEKTSTYLANYNILTGRTEKDVADVTLFLRTIHQYSS